MCAVTSAFDIGTNWIACVGWERGKSMERHFQGEGAEKEVKLKGK